MKYAHEATKIKQAVRLLQEAEMKMSMNNPTTALVSIMLNNINTMLLNIKARLEYEE
jgi:hypothetical protein